MQPQQQQQENRERTPAFVYVRVQRHSEPRDFRVHGVWIVFAVAASIIGPALITNIF